MQSNGDDSAMEPRNLEQVYSVKRKMMKLKTFEDDVSHMMYLAIVHSEYLPRYKRYDGALYASSRLPEMDHHFNQLLKSHESVVLHYDTTFNCGDFFVSMLVFRHPFLQGRPVLPLRFLFHDSKHATGHKMLFKELKLRFPMLEKRTVVLISDREQAFKDVAKKYFPKCYHLFCYIHLYRVSA